MPGKAPLLRRLHSPSTASQATACCRSPRYLAGGTESRSKAASRSPQNHLVHLAKAKELPGLVLHQEMLLPPAPMADIGCLFGAITALSDCALHNDGEREEAGLKKLEANPWFPAKGWGCSGKERARQERPRETRASPAAPGGSAPTGSWQRGKRRKAKHCSW